ncbi:MAG TPA: hypothetical protein VIP46_17980 [Pyrinomonadaceae bacterium]
MPYIPVQFKGQQIKEGQLSDNMNAVNCFSLVRKAKLIRYVVDKRASQILLYFAGRTSPFVIDLGQQMRFGDESISAYEYCKRALEVGDLLDFIIQPNSITQVLIYWFHVRHLGSESEAGKYSKKEEGLFAFKTKSGEKAERLVTRLLRDKYGHQFSPELLDNPGVFTIYYKGKKTRKPDRVCSVCNLNFEVKKRNRDRHYRVSHSEARPFASENSADGWHAFVFPDMSVHFVPNAKIISAIQANIFTPGRDGYDSWATLDRSFIKDETPPVCTYQE